MLAHLHLRLTHRQAALMQRWAYELTSSSWTGSQRYCRLYSRQSFPAAVNVCCKLLSRQLHVWSQQRCREGGTWADSGQLQIR